MLAYIAIDCALSEDTAGKRVTVMVSQVEERYYYFL